MYPLTTALTGLQIVGSLGNAAGDGVLSFDPRNAVPHIVDVSYNNDATQRVRLTSTSQMTILAEYWAAGGPSVNQNALRVTINGAANYTFEQVQNNMEQLLDNFIADVNAAGIGVTASNPGVTYPDDGPDGVVPVGVAEVQAFVASQPPILTWQAPQDSGPGTAVIAKEGIVTLRSETMLAEIDINVTVSALPATVQADTVTVAQDQRVNANKWYFRRSSVGAEDVDLLLTITMANGNSYPLRLDDSTKSIDLVTASRPESVEVSLAETVDPGTVQEDTISLSYDDLVAGRQSYARITSVISDSSGPQTYAIYHNDPAAVRVLKDQAVNDLRNGYFTGNVETVIRALTRGDYEAELAITMLEAGTNFSELVGAGFTNTEATTLLGVWYSVPSGTQAQQTSGLASLAQIRGLNQANFITLLTNLDNEGVNLPLADLRDVAARPNYSANDISLIQIEIENILDA